MPNRNAFRLITVAGATALSLALAACGGGDTATTGGDKIDPIAAPAGKTWSQTVVQTENGYRIGNPDAPLQLVEFASFTCSHCAQFSAAASEELKRDFIDSGRVSWEVRPFIRDPLDLLAASVALCAGTERFFPLSENFFASQEQLFAGAQAAPEAAQNMGALPEAQRYTSLARAWKLDEFFAARGIAAADLDRCLSDTATVNKHIQATENAGKEYEITGTPTFLLNNQVIPNVAEWPALRERLQAAGAR